MTDQPKRCPKHPRYEAKRKPTCDCKECQAIYDEKKFQEAVDRHSEMVVKRDEAKRALYAEEALLTLNLLRELAHDVWGSAELHFDGDCFGEFEWCVIMRGGGFSQHRTFAQGLTAMQAVLAGLTVKLRACRNKEFKRHLQGLQKYYGDKHAEIAAKLKALD